MLINGQIVVEGNLLQDLQALLSSFPEYNSNSVTSYFVTPKSNKLCVDRSNYLDKVNIKKQNKHLKSF
ncbi:MAG: hypothetical protein AB8U25_02395 [Rickettsiales endosymbiont of Dermacentor nuttalli]